MSFDMNKNAYEAAGSETPSIEPLDACSILARKSAARTHSMLELNAQLCSTSIYEYLKTLLLTKKLK